MKTIKFLGLTVLLSMMSTGVILAQKTGLQVMQTVYNLPSGEDTQAELSMVLTNKQGEKRVRQLKQYISETGGVEKKIMYFVSPADVKGTSFMNWSYSTGKEDDQWIYLPALKRTKRISSGSKGDYFMGSDFTYDDLGDRHPDQDTHKLVREETVAGKACYVVESKPKTSGHMYSKTITWVMKDNFIGLKREFYDPNGKLLKTLLVKNYQKISGIWVILETEMKNVQKNHSTTITLRNVKVNQGVPASKFTERSMTMGS
ncbi:MAG: outer membrane lipoprotein-sorting protein [Paludibacter sp.]|nr:outer membrane lipoprotein-sorting protein [Paludibacter sp.]